MRNKVQADNDQPWINAWPMWDEPLSKFPASVDIAAARERLARRFNSRPVRLAKQVEIERSWRQHRKDYRQCGRDRD